MRLAALTVISMLATHCGVALAQLYTPHEIAGDRARLAGRVTELHRLLTRPQYLRQQRTLEPLDEYLAMLRWKPESDWPGGAYPDPLEAFGVPPGAWESDASLAELGTSLRNEAWAFVLAHELAHVLHAHPGNSAPAATSQANEGEADALYISITDYTGSSLMLHVEGFGSFPFRAASC